MWPETRALTAVWFWFMEMVAAVLPVLVTPQCRSLWWDEELERHGWHELSVPWSSKRAAPQALGRWIYRSIVQECCSVKKSCFLLLYQQQTCWKAFNSLYDL